MSQHNELDQTPVPSDKEVITKYFELQLDRFLIFDKFEDFEYEEDEEYEEAFLDFPDLLAETDDDASARAFTESTIQAMVEYYHLSFRAIEIGQYLIAALSLVEYLQNIPLLSETNRDESGNLFSVDSDNDSLLTWFGNCNELRKLIKKLENVGYIEELSGHITTLNNLDMRHSSQGKLSSAISLN